MIGQVSSIYFRAYQLAYDMAKKAEKCYRYELGISNSSFISFGYWDGLKQGLLSGDKLVHDLHLLEADYLEKNKRQLELTKHISLAQMFPGKLLEIITAGETILDLPEWLFNMDYPSHYMRRIKSVSISIPSVAGPYTNINCTLTLLNNSVRISALNPSPYDRSIPQDNRFVDQIGAIQSIATSHGQNDSGMFELNFNDERYLPFEGAGAISSWKISLPAGSNMFDLKSVSDVILHINYTAKDGGAVLAGAASISLSQIQPPYAAIIFSMKNDFPTEWNDFIENYSGGTGTLNFEIKDEHKPYFARGLNQCYQVFFQAWGQITLVSSLLGPQGQTQISIDLSPDNGTGLNRLYVNSLICGEVTGSWSVNIASSNPPAGNEDLTMIIILT